MANRDYTGKWAPDAVIVRAKQEINAEIENGRIPQSVVSFSELHDYVDANEFGGLCDDDCPAVGVAWSSRAANYCNSIQDALDAWIKTGRRT